MNFEELIHIPFDRQSILLLGRPASGKTWLSKALSPMYPHHHVIHCDDYKDFAEPVAIQALIEDAYENKPCIVEGVLGYGLLLQGLKEQSYRPDIIIICEISAARQREIYLSERDPSKLQFQKRFYQKLQLILHECYKLMSKLPSEEYPNVIIFQNEFDAIKK